MSLGTLEISGFECRSSSRTLSSLQGLLRVLFRLLFIYIVGNYIINWLMFYFLILKLMILFLAKIVKIKDMLVSNSSCHDVFHSLDVC